MRVAPRTASAALCGGMRAEAAAQAGWGASHAAKRARSFECKLRHITPALMACGGAATGRLRALRLEVSFLGQLWVKRVPPELLPAESR